MGKRQRYFGSLLLIIAFLSLAVSCHKKQVAAPSPPPAPAPAPPPPEPVATLSAEPATVEKGHAVTLRWSSQNATTMDLQPQVGSVQATGSTTLTPEESTTYVLTATGPGGTVTKEARVTVVPPPPPPPPPATKVEVTEEQLFDTQIRDAYYDFDKSDIRADAQQALTADGEFFKANPEITFTIEGHCDERGSEEYNMGLGERRALAAKNFLVNLGVKPERVFTISFGKGHPTCTESAEECWQKNRRAHFKFGR